MTPRELLNALRWRDERLDEGVVVSYRHRGAPGDVRVVTGDRIGELRKGSFELAAGGPTELGGEASIPYHRVLLVEVDGRTVWERR